MPRPADRGFKDKNHHRDQQRLRGDASVIFDVGANIGQSVAEYRALFPEAHIYAFEPDPAAFAELMAATQNDLNVTCENVALSDTEGETVLHTYEETVMNSFMPFSKKADAYVPFSTDLKSSKPIAVTTLDTYCAEHDVAHIDILKIDTQGAELKILTGAERFLARNNIDLVFCEHIFVDIYDGQADPFAVMLKLSNSGFALFDFYDFYYEKTGQLKWGDALYKHHTVPSPPRER